MELKRDNYGCFVKKQTKEMEKLKAKGVQEHKPFEGIAFKEQSLLLGVGGDFTKMCLRRTEPLLLANPYY